MKTVVILGSSRPNGNTRQAVDELSLLIDVDVIDLSTFTIHQYDYEHKNKHDDFLHLIRKLIQNYDTWIFATPVYWYSMSGIMKVFFDRFTDLLDNEKELGRQLRQKNMAVISSSNGDNLGEQFWIPFMETAKYLGMNYFGHIHTVVDEDCSAALKEFATVLKQKGSGQNF